ncbi:MAG: DegT/DnrJ/EryC1/StrS family aminotransferase [Thermoleophilaceae bacterium]|nr:DegT/DnrJ/EryC1/StrS family aminotransferase [Thermoleophilaceae bacterium]
MRTVTLHQPQVRANSVHFAWDIEPASSLYRQNSFRLDFPDTVDVSTVPMAVWLRVMMICLHTQWGLMRPCKVVAPFQLPHGEYEFWMRFVDAAVWALEADRDGDELESYDLRTARMVEVVGSGGPIGPMPAAPDNQLVATAFSGGRDSLTQLGLLQELGETPLLVTVTSDREGSEEFKTQRRRAVIEAAPARRDVELVEIASDLRSCWNNNDPLAARYRIGISEIADTLLYFSAAWATAWARGARSVFLASESEVQENAVRDGMVIQHKHFMYSAVTQTALRTLIAPSGIGHCGLTYPLRQFQVQRLLGLRYPDLRDLQYSCWSQRPGEDVCSRCRECFEIAVNLMNDGIAPSEIGIDLNELLPAMRDWRPGGEPSRPRGIVGTLASVQVDAQYLRFFRSTATEDIERFAPPPGLSADAVDACDEIRATVLAAPDPGPEPGFRAAYLDLIDERLRARLESILSEHFEAEPLADYAATIRRTHALGDWIAAPLSRAPQRAASEHRSPHERPRAPAPAEPSAGQLAEIAAEIPGPEPLAAGREGVRALPVADTDLSGNELAYVTEAIASNWVSSTGPYVEQFEAAFAAYCGARFAVTTASGATALELMLRAGGIGPGDEVIMPTFTMVATANAVHHVGAKIVFVDSDLATWNMDLRRVVESIGPKTRAIIAMHTYGHPVDMDALRHIADANSLALFEDAAEAHGAKLRGRRIGSTSDAAAFSFYGNKIVTTGEGGIVTTDSPELAEAARDLRAHAFSSDRHFWHRRRAFNYRMSNLQAALGLAQLERIDGFLERRRTLSRLYREHLGPIPGLTLPPTEPGFDDANWMFGVMLDDDFPLSRDELRQHLAGEAIETRTFFVPLHLQPAYIDEFEGRRHPGAERMGRTGLYLPSTLWLTEEDVARVADAVEQVAAPLGAGRLQAESGVEVDQRNGGGVG